MKMNILSIAILIVNVLLIVNVKAATDMNNDANDIIKVLADEYDVYKQQLTGKNDVHDCNVVLTLVSKAKVMLNKPSQNTKENETRNRAYYAAWRLCLRMKQNSKDMAVQKMILNEWNNSLKNNVSDVPFQLYALSGSLWDRAFLTEDFWKHLQKTNKKKTISAFCFVLYQNGNATDVKQLKEKRRSGIDIELQEVIQNAINWTNYRLSGDKTNPGPAAAPPVMDIE